MRYKRDSSAPARRWLPVLLVPLFLLAATAAAQLSHMIVVPYHSQLPQNDPKLGNLPPEPGNAVTPNGFCTCACMEMVFHYLEGASAGHGAQKPWPQMEIAAVANTNDSQGASAWSGTYIDDARRAVHFSSASGGWPANPGVNYVVPPGGGYSWRTAGPRGARYGFVGIEGNWFDEGWTRQQLRTRSAADYPLIVNVYANTMGRDVVIPDSLESQANESDYENVEDTVSGHSVVLVGYDDRPARNLFQLHCPTFGAFQVANQDTFWNYMWTGDFLFIAPWGSSVGVPQLGSINPNGFQISGQATYDDKLPTMGTGTVMDTTKGRIVFTGAFPIVATLAQGQTQVIGFDVAQSGDTDLKNWNCVTTAWGTSDVIVDTWGELSESSTSYGGYSDDIGSVVSDTVHVPPPQAGDVVCCDIPRWRWWHGKHLLSHPHHYAPGVPNDFSAEIRNQGILPVTNVYVDFDSGDPSLVHFSGQPELMPFGMTMVPVVAPGETLTTSPVGFMASGYNSFSQPYYDFFVELHGDGDYPDDLWVETDGNLACKCVHQLEIDPYMGTLLEFWYGNPDPDERVVVTRMETSLPSTWYAQLIPAGMDSLIMGPEEMNSRMLALDVGDPGIGMVDVFEDLYTTDGEFLLRTGGITFLVWTTGTGIPDDEDVAEVALAPPTPNPSDSSIGLTFALPKAGFAELSIFDVSGRLVAVVFSGEADAGRTLAVWDGRDRAGKPVSSGVYFARLAAAGEQRARKVVLIR